jgi:hypothetical protein
VGGGGTGFSPGLKEIPMSEQTLYIDPSEIQVKVSNGVTLIQHDTNTFSVRYGQCLMTRLDYNQAAKEIGCAIMHELTVDGWIDADKSQYAIDAQAELNNADNDYYYSKNHHK